MRKMLRLIVALATIITLANGVSAEAASLRASPTSLELIAPGSATTIRLRNEANKLLHVQVRVFRWSQKDGEEHLEATKDVVASPPSTKLEPNTDYVVRIVRVGKAPVVVEESYRVLVDEVPLRSEHQVNAVNLVVRHSIPLFVHMADVSAPNVSWRWSRRDSGIVLTAHNSGANRLKVYDLTLTQNGNEIVRHKGLVGYVLAGSTMTFPFTHVRVRKDAPLSINANSNIGRFRETVKKS